MSRPAITILATATALALAACDSGSTLVEPESSHVGPGRVLLAVDDLPDGYTTSPPEAAPEMSATGAVSVPGCDSLLNRYRDGGVSDPATTVRFEAGDTGPFLAEEIGTEAGAVGQLRDLAARCAAFTDTDSDGLRTDVTVSPAGLPALGDESIAVRMAASGGTGDDAFALSGYLVVVRVGAATCTLVHFGDPEVDPAETATIARAAVDKLKRRQ